MTVLYLQHAGGLGGSCMSLLYTIQGLDQRRFRPVVACARPHPSVVSLYRDAGIETVECPGVSTFDHTTARWFRAHRPGDVRQLVRQVARWRAGGEATIEVVNRIGPDLVHLNSIVLAPSAAALHRAGRPFVWHVRESPPSDGYRTRLLGRLVSSLPDEAIFISEYDRRSWVDSRAGVVVPNFVDRDRFDAGLDPGEARRSLGLPREGPLVLFVGGVDPVKGLDVLLRAIPAVLRRHPSARFVMPGVQYTPSQTRIARLARAIAPRLGLATPGQRLRERLAAPALAAALIPHPFSTRIEQYFAACDVVVFPSVRPHFARPVVEAGAMARPVVASRLGGVVELVDDGRTGVLVEPRDPASLADGIARLLDDSDLRRSLGASGQRAARTRFDAHTNVAAIQAVYERVLATRCGRHDR